MAAAAAATDHMQATVGQDEAIAVMCGAGVSLGTAVRLASRLGGLRLPLATELPSDPGDSADDHAILRGFPAGLLKLRGNKALQAGSYELAVELYTTALDEVRARAAAHPTDGGRFTPPAHVLLSNRSAALLALGRNEGALADADECQTLAPQWPKAYFRRSQALRALGRTQDAANALQLGLAKPGLTEADRATFTSLLKELRPEEHLPPQQQNTATMTTTVESGNEDEDLQRALRMSMEGIQTRAAPKTAGSGGKVKLPTVLDQTAIQRAYQEELIRKQQQQANSKQDDTADFFELSSGDVDDDMEDEQQEEITDDDTEDASKDKRLASGAEQEKPKQQ